jgi:hypothetical protein
MKLKAVLLEGLLYIEKLQTLMVGSANLISVPVLSFDCFTRIEYMQMKHQYDRDKQKINAHRTA